MTAHKGITIIIVVIEIERPFNVEGVCVKKGLTIKGIVFPCINLHAFSSIGHTI